ncbi:MAG: hypothetical protein ACLS37_13800 [Alistipes sp.]
MDNTVIVTTPAQLQSIITDAVNAILPKLADFRRKNEPVETDGVNWGRRPVPDRAGRPHYSGNALQSHTQKYDPVQEGRTPHSVLEKGAFGVG